ncbi:MAG: MFS transporter [Spirochaetaceae bacterium]|nr:MFS transporter [Spirochaetaceae bacterium]
MPLIAPRFRGLYSALFCVFALFGTSMTIVGAALPKILSDFGWSYGVAGAVIAANALAYFLSSLAGGAALRLVGPKRALVGGLAACAAGLAFFAATPSPWLNLLLNALIGAGQGLLEPTVNWSVLRMEKEGSSRAMNTMHGAFAIGAVAGPVALGAMLAAGAGWTLLFRGIAGLLAVLAAILAALPFASLGMPESDASGERSRAASLARRPAYWLGFSCLLLYVGAELGISNWISEYFVRVFGAAPERASLMVSVFWIGLLSGRFGVPALYKGSRQEAVLVAACVLLLVSTVALNALGYLAPGAGALAGPVLVFLSGLGCSIVYPTVVSMVGFSIPEAQADAVSFAVSGGGVGLFSFPFLMSWISQGFGIRAGFASYAAVAALTLVSCVALARVFATERAKRIK